MSTAIYSESKPSRSDYIRFIQSTIVNYTQTYMAEHHPAFSHDAINRYLMEDDVSPQSVWMTVKKNVRLSENACLIFDDTVLDKRHSFNIELVRRQYSGNAHGVIKGIGLVNCVYVNLDTGAYWIIDWRFYDPDTDGRTKLDHVREMFDDALIHKKLPFQTVLMDSWYAARQLMVHIDRAGKHFYCPIKSNRKVDDSQGRTPYKAVADLDWLDDEWRHGKQVKIYQFPKNFKVKLFRVAATHRTDYVVTNDLSQDSVAAVEDWCAVRWKVEQYHRESKQMLGLEKCQCRKARAQKNHIGCVILAWHSLTRWAKTQGSNIYSLKYGLFSRYMKEEMKNPSIPLCFA